MTCLESPLVLSDVLPVLLPLIVPLYHRITREEVLETRMRRDVLRAFMTEPGATASDAAKWLEVDYKTIVHHARVLKRFGLLTTRRDGRRVRYYATARVHRQD